MGGVSIGESKWWSFTQLERNFQCWWPMKKKRIQSVNCIWWFLAAVGVIILWLSTRTQKEFVEEDGRGEEEEEEEEEEEKGETGSNCSKWWIPDATRRCDWPMAAAGRLHRNETEEETQQWWATLKALALTLLSDGWQQLESISFSYPTITNSFINSWLMECRCDRSPMALS